MGAADRPTDQPPRCNALQQQQRAAGAGERGSVNKWHHRCRSAASPPRSAAFADSSGLGRCSPRGAAVVFVQLCRLGASLPTSSGAGDFRGSAVCRRTLFLWTEPLLGGPRFLLPSPRFAQTVCCRGRPACSYPPRPPGPTMPPQPPPTASGSGCALPHLRRGENPGVGHERRFTMWKGQTDMWGFGRTPKPTHIDMVLWWLLSVTVRESTHGISAHGILNREADSAKQPINALSQS